MALQFGLLLPQGWTMELAGIKDPTEAYETMTRIAQTAEEVGFASIWLVDHFHTIPRPSQEMTFECWMSTAALARDTRTIRIGQMVTCNSYRHPALLAKMASTVDVLSHGRLNLGIGAGWDEHEYRAYGYEYPDAPGRLRALGKAVRLIHTIWSRKRPALQATITRYATLCSNPEACSSRTFPCSSEAVVSESHSSW
jgi:alkanesulfonate monooxygenase SsuD/methylene tetrahydromethanopterin reductase-like flavin-dependent oxidoreductase (luciferase family)